MWKCIVIRKVWNNILCWWDIVGKVYIEDSDSMWNSARIFTDPRIKLVWFSTIAATLWTIWLERNSVIFSGIIFKEERLLALIQLRTLEWNLAACLIISCKAPWWKVNPGGVVLASFKCKLQEHLASGVQLVAFTDGSFKVDKNKGVLGGIGGVLKNRRGKKIMSFSGPAQVFSPFEAEEKALDKLISLLRSFNWRDSSITQSVNDKVRLLIHSDNAVLVGAMDKNRKFLQSLSDLLIEVQHIAREFNFEADCLAKGGALLDSVQVHWA